MKNWLCKPTSLEEAKEIVERAVANGAKLVDKPAESSDSHEYRWNLCDSWGVIEGETNTSVFETWDGEIEILTIDQVREQFPLPNEESGDVKFYHDIGWLLNALKLGATHHTNNKNELYKIDNFDVWYYHRETEKWSDSEWMSHRITAENGFYPIDYSPLDNVTKQPDKRVKWEDLEPNSIDWLEFAKSIGATHWHELVMRFAKAGDGHSCMMFGDNGWEINEDHVCPSRYPEYWEHYLIDYSISEWNGEGYPHVGAKCFKDGQPVVITYVGKDVICFQYLNTKAEHSVYKTVAEFTIAKSERELWIEDAVEVMEQSLMVNGSPEQKCRLYAEAIYDKMINQK